MTVEASVGREDLGVGQDAGVAGAIHQASLSPAMKSSVPWIRLAVVGSVFVLQIWVGVVGLEPVSWMLNQLPSLAGRAAEFVRTCMPSVPASVSV